MPQPDEAAALRERFGTASPSERLRTDLRAACLRSTYAFGQAVCGYGDLHPVLHGTMSKWVDGPSRRKLGLVPRGHLKTSLWTIAGSLRRATADPNTRILIVNEVAARTENWIGAMKAIVLSPLYAWLFPGLAPDPSDRAIRWNRSQLELVRTERWPEPTIEGIGTGGASTGSHYRRIVNDDLIGKEARESPAVMDKAWDQYGLSDSLCVDPSMDAIDYYGTRWAPDDVPARILRATGARLDYLHLRVRTPDGAYRWPERFNDDVMAGIMDVLGPALTALQYDNEALADGATEFDEAHLRRYRMTSVPRADGDGHEPALTLLRTASEGGARTVRLAQCTLFQTIDAGLSPESTDARTANVVVALTPAIVNADGMEIEPHGIVLLEADAVRADPTAAMRRAWEIYERWQPSVAGIEVFGAHVVYFHALVRTYPRMRLTKLPTDTHKSKLTRIREFYTFVGQGRVYVPERGMQDFRTEYVAFPNGRTVDLLDALAYAPRIWWEPAPTTDEGAAAVRLPYGADPDEAREEARREADAEASRSPVTGY